MDRKEFIKRLFVGGVGISFLPSLLSGSGLGKGSVKPVNLPAEQDHVRHGLFSPMDAATLAAGPAWLTHFRKDRFLSNGFGVEDSDMVHLTLGLNGKPLGITIKGDKAFVGREDGKSESVQLPSSGNQLLFKTRRYEAWVVAGSGNLKFPEGKAPEAFFLPLQQKVLLHGFKANPAKALWVKGNIEPEIRHPQAGRSLVLLKFA